MGTNTNNDLANKSKLLVDGPWFLKEYLKCSNFSDSICVEIKCKFEGYKSFKIGVDDENVNQILSPAFWGKGVRCFCKRVCPSS